MNINNPLSLLSNEADVAVDLRVEIALLDNFPYSGDRLRVPDGVGNWEPAPNCGGRGGAAPIRGGQYMLFALNNGPERPARVLPWALG